ncbi:MAG: iron-containing alcohol dehydrogenase [Acidimicrobiia bacterium]|nr:iron-containing alcohol dehydrogenase [Acidimicrobiia bacterium]MDH5521397.1 iron-containing alcohol dehydrogenase [Acidimicrobiia bacterium]
MTIGQPFTVIEVPVVDVLGGIGPYTAVVNDPPWSAVAGRVRPPVRVVTAGNMEQAHLDRVVDAEDRTTEVVVGLGGGTALDTAKYLAWRTGKRLVQIPTITSVDAGFTDAVGIRVDGKVRYVGNVVPETVALDLPLIRSAPARLNQAGIGDILSCHTGLFDWRLAVDAGDGVPWREDLAALGETLLVQLEQAVPDICAVSDDGVRFMADAYRRIGAACAEAGHSRFEEGSEHFWAYNHEHRTGAHHVHGELIGLAVVAMSMVQDNRPDWAFGIVAGAGARCNPADLGIDRDDFAQALLTLRNYARAEDLDYSIVDAVDVDQDMVDRAWDLIARLPRVEQ